MATIAHGCGIHPCLHLSEIKSCTEAPLEQTALTVTRHSCAQKLSANPKLIMTQEIIKSGSAITREQMIALLNEDLSGEYQAIIAYTVYSQVLKGAAYTDIARKLEAHAGEELAHAIKIAKQIDYLGGMPCVTPKPVKTSKDPVEILRADLENERETVGRYRERIRQAEAMGEFIAQRNPALDHCAGTGA